MKTMKPSALTIKISSVLTAFRAAQSTSPTVWGKLPALSIVMAIGVSLISVACSGSRADAEWAQPVFWLGYLVLIVPPIVRLSIQKVTRQERIGTLVLLGLCFYCIKVLYSPLVFSFNDELQHWRSTDNIVQKQLLFQDNPTLPVSAFFPSLENVTHAILTISGLTIFQSGIVVIGVARLLSMLSLYLLYERVSGSAHTASIACLVYFAHPSFMLAYAQFAYEPLAVSLFVLGLFIMLRRVQILSQTNPLRLTVVLLLCLLATIVTHHVTSYTLALLLCIWAIMAYWHNNRDEWRIGPGWFALLAISGCLAWLALGGPVVTEYVGVPVRNAFAEVIKVISGELAPRAFFQSKDGKPVSLWLQVPSYASVILIALTIPPGLLAIWYKKHRMNSLALALGVMSLGYPVSQILRLAPLGLGLTNRLASIVFLPLSFVLAMGAVEVLQARYVRRWWQIALVVWLCVVNVGSATAVVAAWQLPGPYNRNIFTRKIAAQGLATAEWAEDTLGPGNRFGADLINMLILGSYGDQRLVTELNDKIFIEASIYSSPEFGEAERGLLRKGSVEYLVIDNRLSNQLVLDQETPNLNTYQTKLDGLSTISRIFDSGDISIYHFGFVSQSSEQSDASQTNP